MNAESFQIRELPPAADPAVAIVRRLVDAGHQALLAGGCVRDLLRDDSPADYDVATDARPDEILKLFRTTRKVGVQFGVVLVKSKGRWVEVATFRSDDEYADGRRPVSVRFTDAVEDARRRDFTVNGMFLDPFGGAILDYVGGAADLRAKRIRAIGTPAQRFAEDHLRLIRAVRFAARLGFEIEAATREAIQAHAERLRDVAAERILQELEKILVAPTRARAAALLDECRLLGTLWPAAAGPSARAEQTVPLLEKLPRQVSFVSAFSCLVLDHDACALERIARALSFSNDQREAVLWTVGQRDALLDAGGMELAALKRLMANPSFDALRVVTEARLELQNDERRRDALRARLSVVAPDAVAPTPFLTGQDLIDRGLPPGPRFKELLDAVYTAQLNEDLTDREQAMRLLDRLLRDSAHGH